MIENYVNDKEVKEKFDVFYDANLKHLFNDMEKSRKKYLKLFIISAFCVFGLLPFIFLLQLDNILAFLENSSISADIFIWGYVIAAGVVALPVTAYKLKNKKIIMPEFIKFFDGFSYIHKKGVSDYVVKKSAIFDKIYDKKEADDYFEGVYKGVNVRISEEKLIKITKSEKSGESKKNLFKGVFVALEMNKNFEGQTIGKKDLKMLNRFNKPEGYQNIKLEDIVFEKEWEVYSDNQIEARYLLTTAFMDRLLKVKSLYHSNRLQFAFFDNILFLAIDMKGDMFETSSIFKSTFDKKHINETLEQFLSVLTIVDILKLNLKIGM